MSIELKIDALIAALEANTAALQGAGGAAKTGASSDAAGAAEKTTRTRTTKAKDEPKAASKRSKAEMQAALNEVREALGTAKAKGLIKGAGFDKLADVTEDKFDALYDAAKALLDTDGAGEETEDDGL
jgi:hypothetical protein